MDPIIINDKLDGDGKKMPVLFVGHGSPMNAIEDNQYTKQWEMLGKELPRPDVILSVSAHWYVNGSRVNQEEKPEIIYDMYGFPQELYDVRYSAPGSPELADRIKTLIPNDVQVDNSWGIDHGTWSVLCRMYPDADIPVLQLSIDSGIRASEHFQLGQELARLRTEGVLILGSGNVVHNLAEIDWNMHGGYEWAEEFDQYVQRKIRNREYQGVIEYSRAGKCSQSAFFTPEHYYPLLYVLGASTEKDELTVFNDSCLMGSLSMTSYLFR